MAWAARRDCTLWKAFVIVSTESSIRSVRPVAVKLGLMAAVLAAFILCGIAVVKAVGFSSHPVGGETDIVMLVCAILIPLLILGLVTGGVAVSMAKAGARASCQRRIDSLQQRVNYQEDLVRLIADNRTGAMSIIDSEGRFWFVNHHMAARFGLSPEEMVGRALDKVLPGNEALRLRLRLRQLQSTGQSVTVVDRVNDQKTTRFRQTTLVTLPSISYLAGGVLVSDDDVTTMMVDREARERTFRQVIDTLVAVVDRRDPYAAGHSVRVGQVASLLAENMWLSLEQIETAEIAGLLMNFGKVLVPREILTKTGTLTAEELRQVREAIMSSVDILSLIGFSQPVVPTLRQVLERYDGTGEPQGLKGEDILLTARIVTVANAFVALVSPRAHRPGLSASEAVQALQKDAGKIYDGRVIDVLGCCLDASGDKLEWLAKA